jgi:hypothetical protein
MVNEDNIYIFLMFCLLRMSEEKNIDKMTYVKVSSGNIERIKAIGKKGKTFNDVVSKLLDYYEDLQREDLTNIQSNENQYQEQIKDKRRSYASWRAIHTIKEK